MDGHPTEPAWELSRQLDELTAQLRAQDEKIAQLSTSVSTRDVIGQAKGVLIERYQLTETQAFKLLVGVSNRSNSKLHDVAMELVRTGDFGHPEKWSTVMKEVVSNELPKDLGAVGRDDALGAAKYLLMQRYKLDEQQAFDFLVEMSLEMNVNVIEVAMHVLRTES